jgi:hypothetical protein
MFGVVYTNHQGVRKYFMGFDLESAYAHARFCEAVGMKDVVVTVL